MTFAALDNWWSDPVMAHRTVKVTNQCIVINETSAGAQLMVARVGSACSSYVSGRRFPHATLAGQRYRRRPRIAVTPPVGHRITTGHRTVNSDLFNTMFVCFDILGNCRLRFLHFTVIFCARSESLFTATHTLRHIIGTSFPLRSPILE